MDRCRLGQGHARDRVRLARALDSMAVAVAALQEGSIDTARARILADVAHHHADHFAAAETHLVSAAAGGSVADRSVTFAQRQADALHDVCRFFLDSSGTSVSGGERPHVTVVVELETVERRATKRCELDHCGVVHPRTARKPACDAGISRASPAS